LLLTMTGGNASSQGLVTELETTFGYSTEGIRTAAGQLRTFGEVRPGVRLYVEAVAADRTEAESDAFSAGYSYATNLALTESYLEHHFREGRSPAGVRAGRFRPPFGLYDRSEHAYNGFLRPPLVRLGYWQGVSNYWLDSGVSLFGGSPSLQVEASVGAPGEDRDALTSRARGSSLVARVQTQQRNLVAGVSYVKTRPYPAGPWVAGHGEFTGIDARWMSRGVQLRGEWIGGRPFDGARTTGWYLDARVHRVDLGPIMPVLRYEEYSYEAGPMDVSWERLTAGARVRVTPALTAQVNMLLQSGATPGSSGALDVALTHTRRF